MRITFLGTGTSRGIPLIGCTCDVCTSDDPRNKRLRTSILIESDINVVIDASVDFRSQMLLQRVKTLDAVILTHPHVDHILGLDDLYPFTMRTGKNMPIYGNNETLKEVRTTFRYLFSDKRYPGIPALMLHVIDSPFQIGDLRFEPIPLLHGHLPIFGYRVGCFAFLTDVSKIPEESYKKLHGVRYLALDALRDQPHFSHFSLNEAIEAAERIGADQTYLIHMCHNLDHEATNKKLPDKISLAYDGLLWELRQECN